MKFGAEDPSREPDRIGHWATFDAFCLEKDIVRRDTAVSGFINMCVILRMLHRASDKGQRVEEKWIAELEDSEAYESIDDLEDEPFDRLRQLVASCYAKSLQPRPAGVFSLTGPDVSGHVSALSSGSSIAEQYFAPDEEGGSVLSDAHDSAFVAADAQFAARLVVAEAREETRR